MGPTGDQDYFSATVDTDNRNNIYTFKLISGI